ncbi:MAG TPA: response regulator [Steroidobacteraceae bacterium]|nr:response regulator [Steroidobacteraceae bacterium]
MQVLIVDDSADAAASLTMLLELEDIGAQSVGDAEAALRLVEQTVPLMFLIDIGLPGMNGYELARRLRQLPRLNGVTLIALTGREGPSPQEQALFDQFWTKPFDPRRLIEEVRGVISRAADRSPA